MGSLLGGFLKVCEVLIDEVFINGIKYVPERKSVVYTIEFEKDFSGKLAKMINDEIEKQKQPGGLLHQAVFKR